MGVCSLQRHFDRQKCYNYNNDEISVENKFSFGLIFHRSFLKNAYDLCIQKGKAYDFPWEDIGLQKQSKSTDTFDNAWHALRFSKSGNIRLGNYALLTRNFQLSDREFKTAVELVWLKGFHYNQSKDQSNVEIEIHLLLSSIYYNAYFKGQMATWIYKSMPQ